MTEKPNDIYGSIPISDTPPDPASGPPRDKKTAAKKPQRPAKPAKPAPPGTPAKPSKTGQASRPPEPPPARPAKPASAPRPPRPPRSARRPPADPRIRETSGSGRKLGVWFTIFLLLFGLYSAAGYLLVPYLIQNSLPDYLKEKADVLLSVGRTSFNPYNFKLVMRDISAETMENGRPADRFLSIDDLRINLDFLSLLRGDLTSSEMRLERLKLHVIRKADKSYNISHLLGSRRLRDHSDIMDFAELPFMFSFNNISIAESRVIIEDTIAGKEHVIRDIELALPVVSNFPYQTDSYIHPRFSAVINGSPVSLTGEASIGAGQPNRQTQLSCDINDIDIPLYFDYLPLTLPVDISKGTANGILYLTFSPEQEKGSRFKIRFDLETTDLSLESRDAKMSLNIPNAKLEGELEPFSRALDFKSILLREPAIVSDSMEDAPLGATLASLAPMALRPPPENKLHTVIPPISIKLMIADGGTFTVVDRQKNTSLQRWESIQLSIKDFTNDRLFPSEVESSFRLSGEHGANAAYFTWQGIFDKQNHPGGNLQLSNVPASLIAPFLGREAKDISGKADLQGLLTIESFSSDTSQDRLFDYSLKSSKLSIKDVVLKDQGVEWLRTPDLRCEPVSKIRGITDYGNVYMQNSTVALARDRLPFLFATFSARPTRHILHGIDFSGQVTIKEVPSAASPQNLVLRDVVFQANQLEKQQTQKDNFVFSAHLGADSEVKTRGSLHIAPLQINTEIAATNLTPVQLFSWFSSSKTMLENQASLSIKGSFLYPQQTFSGDLAAENVVLGSGKDPALTAASVRLNQFNWSKTRQSLSIRQLLVDQPAFIWRRTAEAASPVALSSNFLRHMLLPETNSDGADPDLALAKSSLTIDRLGISNAQISYVDERVRPPLKLELNGISGDLQSLQYPVAEEDGEITLNGSIEGIPFKLEGSGKLLQSPPAATTSFSASALPLSLFGDQIRGRIKGVDTAQATLTVSHNVTWDSQAPDSETTLSLSQLVPEKPGTELAVALALLSGNDAVTMSLSSSQQYVRPLLDEALDYFSRIMVKASIDPLLLADPEFVDLAEKNFVTFLPGTDQFTGESFERLNRYGELLSAYPLIDLQITGLADPESDVAQLQKELETAEQIRVEVENRKRELEWQKKQELDRMKLKIWQESGQGEIDETDIEVTDDKFIPVTARPVQVSNDMLSELGLRREQAVIDHLIEQLSIAPERLRPAQAGSRNIIRGGESPRAVITLKDGFARLAENTDEAADNDAEQ